MKLARQELLADKDRVLASSWQKSSFNYPIYRLDSQEQYFYASPQEGSVSRILVLQHQVSGVSYLLGKTS